MLGIRISHIMCDSKKKNRTFRGPCGIWIKITYEVVISTQLEHLQQSSICLISMNSNLLGTRVRLFLDSIFENFTPLLYQTTHAMRHFISSTFEYGIFLYNWFFSLHLKPFMFPGSVIQSIGKLLFCRKQCVYRF